MKIIGVGIDLVPVDRIAGMLAEHGERFVARTFTAAEIAECRGTRREAERFASRFAAKEAVFKAMGTGLTRGMSMVEVGVKALPSGQPSVELTGVAAGVAAQMGITGWMISLTDTAGVSGAVAIAVG